MPSAATIDREPSTSESVIARLKLWRNWVLANVMGEVVGFGLAAMIGVAAIQMIEPLAGVTLIAAVVVAVIAVGVVEGGAVGLAHGWCCGGRSRVSALKPG